MTSASYFPDDGRLFYFWKGRVALYAILKALDIGPGDEIILPGFTCVVVANACLYLGATPIFADIEPDTYNSSIRTIEPLISQRTRIIIAQNTFGLSSDLDPIMDMADKNGIKVIEDCAHGLGGHYRGRRNGTIAHATFFSSQWSKPISTGLGGVAYVRDEALAQRIAQIVETMPKPDISAQAMLAAQLLAHPLISINKLYYPLVKAYRFLTQKVGLSVGSSTGDELEATEQPSKYARRMGKLQQQRWKRGLAKLDNTVKRRQEVAARYNSFFATIDITSPYQPKYANHSMLRYSVRVPDKAEFLKRSRQMRIPIGDWYQSPLHPVSGDLSAWGYRAGQCPVGEQACRETINLLTDYPLSLAQLETLFQD